MVGTVWPHSDGPWHGLTSKCVLHLALAPLKDILRHEGRKTLIQPGPESRAPRVWWGGRWVDGSPPRCGAWWGAEVEDPRGMLCLGSSSPACGFQV